MLRGTMEVLVDSVSKEMIWQEGDIMYYPEGVTDSDYCIEIWQLPRFIVISNRRAFIVE